MDPFLVIFRISVNLSIHHHPTNWKKIRKEDLLPIPVGFGFPLNPLNILLRSSSLRSLVCFDSTSVPLFHSFHSFVLRFHIFRSSLQIPFGSTSNSFKPIQWQTELSDSTETLTSKSPRSQNLQNCEESRIWFKVSKGSNLY